MGNAWVGGNARVYGDACVYCHARIGGNAMVCGKAQVGGDASVCGNAVIDGGDTVVCGYAVISGCARVSSNSDYMVFKNSWGSWRWFTYTSSDRMWQVGCFRGTGDELVKKAYSDSELSGRCYEAAVRAVEAIEMAKAGGAA